MRFVDDQWIFSPTDLATFLRCQHATTLRRKVELGEIPPPEQRRSAHVDLLVRRGTEHEEKYVEKLREQGQTVVEISGSPEMSQEEARDRAIDAMKSGADAIVQAALSDETWFGYADILERIDDKPSTFGDWSYEIVDTKLARNVHPHVILQLGIYSELLDTIQYTPPERLQGKRSERMHVILGDGSRATIDRSELDAYIRHVRSRFLLELREAPETRGYPVEFCALCQWNLHCFREWVADDDLCLVAGIRRDQVKRLRAAGIETLTDLGESDPSRKVADIAAPTFEKLAHQARLQLAWKRDGNHRYEFLDPEERRGFQRLPQPSPGDLFFDVEADPFEALTYLFGIAFRDERGEPRYRAWWAHDQRQEKEKFEEVIDFILERRARYSGAHVYHYGPADTLALKQLMGRFGTREQELDDLLRAETFVDMLGVVRQAIRISHPSYSLKKVETFYMERESEGVIDAGGAIVAYEEWLRSQDQGKLDEIEEYNREDCISTMELQGWLLHLRREVEEERGIDLPWATQSEPQKSPEELEQEELAQDSVSASLLEGLPADLEKGSEEHARWMLANLLHYHRRDEKPAWWEVFNRMNQTAEELVDDKEAIGLLVPTGRTRQVKSSTAVELRFPTQQHKLSEGDQVRDPERRDAQGFAPSAGTIESLDDGEGILELRRGPSLGGAPLPRAIIPNGPVNSSAIQEALRKFARSIVESGFEATEYKAGRDILLRKPPRIRGLASGAPLQTGHLTVNEIVEISRGLERTALFIQGPPGSGKTYRGAKIIVDLLRRGKRVGVCATSHKAVENQIREVERQAHEEGVSFRGLKKSSSDEQRYRSTLDAPLIFDTSDRKNDFPGKTKWKLTDPDVKLVAGTPWCFCPTVKKDGATGEKIEVDVLVIDEAGQMALATALAISTAAESVILLGDPLQLAQVSQGAHPEGCGASVLEHLLGDAPTIPPEKGIFLEKTRRMHPEVCRFISDVVYGGRLESETELANQQVTHRTSSLAGAGLRFIPVEHEGNSQDSPEEAAVIAAAIEKLLDGGTVTTWNWSGDAAETKDLSQDDVKVVTPYNAQVRVIRTELAGRGLGGVQVGTVDKFQGQEAPVVFYSTATSSGEDIPRSLDFLFSRNRLNVAISRAKCLAVLVASPRLLDVNCRTVEQMKLVNALCRFVEMAK